MSAATSSLYALEASAPDSRTAQSAKAVVDTLNDTRAAVDSRAQARYDYRAAEAAPEDDPGRADAMVAGRDRELRTSRNLGEARRRLADALTSLSAIT